MLIGPWASEFIESPVDIRKGSLHLKFIWPVPVRVGLKSLKWICLCILLWQMPISTKELGIDSIFKKSSLRTRKTDSASIVRQSPRDSSRSKGSKKGSLLFYGNKESRKFLSIKMKWRTVFAHKPWKSYKLGKYLRRLAYTRSSFMTALQAGDVYEASSLYSLVKRESPTSWAYIWGVQPILARQSWKSYSWAYIFGA